MSGFFHLALELFPLFGNCEYCCYEQVLVWVPVFNSLGYIARNRNAGPNDKSMFSFFRVASSLSEYLLMEIF